MGHFEIASLINTRFKTLIEDVEILPTQYDNVNFNPPDALWARVNVLEGESIQVDIVGGVDKHRERTPGVLIVQLFQPMNKGEGDIRTMADKIKAAFRAVRVIGTAGVSDLLFRTPTVKRMGTDVKKEQWQLNVSCPFQYDEIA